MDTSNPNFRLGVVFAVIGVALLMVLDNSLGGLAFILIGAHRLYVAYVAGTNELE